MTVGWTLVTASYWLDLDKWGPQGLRVCGLVGVVGGAGGGALGERPAALFQSST